VPTRVPARNIHLLIMIITRFQSKLQIEDKGTSNQHVLQRSRSGCMKDWSSKVKGRFQGKKTELPQLNCGSLEVGSQ
jgi:hypothetical protein